MTERVQAADQVALADANATKKLEAGMRRRRPLVQYVMSRKWPDGNHFPHYIVERSAAGSLPSHWLIHPPEFVGMGDTIGTAREHIPEGFKRMDRRKDDRVDVVEVWV